VPQAREWHRLSIVKVVPKLLT